MADTIREQIQLLLESLPQNLPAIEPTPTPPANVASIIDHTLLAPSSTIADVVQCCKEAMQLETVTVCVNSSMVKTATFALHGSPVRPICTIGFPFGAGSKEAKMIEAQTAVADGAQEIDMVQNVGLLRSGKYESVFEDIEAVAIASRPAALKVILETCFLTREEIAISTLIACKAGAAYVKTSTGYGTGGAKAEDIRLMYEIASTHGVKVKASGGIRSADKVREMVSNGASRVGASGTKAIIAEREGQTSNGITQSSNELY